MSTGCALNTMERMETVSMAATAIENGVSENGIVGIIDQYVWNAYQHRLGVGESAGIAFDASKMAGS